MKKTLVTILLIIITYLFIFSPPLQLIQISISNILAVWAYFVLISNKQRINKLLYFKLEFKILAVLMLYVTIIYFTTGLKSTEVVVSIFKIFLIEFPIALALVLLIERYSKGDFQNYYRMIFINCFLIAGTISIVLFLNPSINDFLKINILRTLDIGTFQKAFLIRGYGFSDSMLYSYPIALSLSLCFIYENSKNWIYPVIISPVLISPIFLNARIGLVPIVAYTFYILLIKKKMIKFFLGLLFIMLIYQYIITLEIKYDYYYYLNWTLLGVENTISFLQNNELRGPFYDLSKMFYFPDNFLFGSGEYIYVNYSIRSDIGYILQIYYGGIILILLYIYLTIIMVKRSIKMTNWNHWFPIITFLTILISNFKGNFFTSNPGMRTIIILYIYYVYNNISIIENNIKNE